VTDYRPILPDPETSQRHVSHQVRETRWLNRCTTATRGWIARHPYIFRGVSGCVLTGALAAAWLTYDFILDLPDRKELQTIGRMVEGTTLYDMHQQPVFTLPAQYHIETPLARISPNLRDAIIAVEDARFYDHDGIDGVRVVAAVLKDMREARAAEGASTITQQLARMSFLTPAKTWRRKIKEAVLAQRLEQIYSKDQILGFYLNKVYFGDGLYGAESAARGYLGKSAADLGPAEAALLAGLVRAPSSTNPAAHADRAVERRNLVLKLMLEHGVLSTEQYQHAIATPLVLYDGLRREDSSGVYFREQVRRELIDRFGKERVYQGHLKVFTTVDPKMQKAAEASLSESLDELDRKIMAVAARSRKKKTVLMDEPPGPLQAALLALDPSSGEVRAIVGGRDITSTGLNRAVQSKRQPGSAFKPFVYAAALEAGMTPATLIEHLDEPIETLTGGWLPEDEHSAAATMTMRTALRTSSNRAAVQMLNRVGIDRVVYAARRLGIGDVPNVPALALGAGDVTLIAMTAAYGAFAQQGVVREPRFIRRVEDEDGEVLFESDLKARQAVSPATAFLMSSMLSDVINVGTALTARTMGFKLPAAGKTGTTNDYVDAWFVGFTSKIVAGVWVGYDNPHTILPNGFAGAVAVPLWTRFMKAATNGDGAVWLQQPNDVVAVKVCRESGMLPAPGCLNAPSIDPSGRLNYKSTVYTEYFPVGSEPTEVCTLHGSSDPLMSATPAMIAPASLIPPPLPVPVPATDASSPLVLPPSEPPPASPGADH